MTLLNKGRLVSFEPLKLLLIFMLAFYIAFIPHHNYSYPIHLDEWIHLSYSNAILAVGSTTFIDPFTGQQVVDLSSNLEAGFHILLSIFKQVTDASWLIIFRYLPGIIFLITVLSVYTLARRTGFGWEAALFTCLIPTSVGILGPAFLVPVAVGLLFVPLSLLLVFHFRIWPSYLVLFVFACFVLFMHPPSAMILFILLLPYIMLKLIKGCRHSFGIIIAFAIPLMALFFFKPEMIMGTIERIFTPQLPTEYVQIPNLIQSYGYLPITCVVLGIISVAKKGGKENIGLLFSMMGLLLMLVIFFRLHRGIPILYERGLLYLMLMLSIIAGVGLMWVRKIKLPSQFIHRSNSLLISSGGNIVFMVLIIATLAIAIPSRLDTPYYHMIDTEDYRAFTWIKNNLNESYDKGILDPWKATAFVAIAQKNIYTRIHGYPKSIDMEAYEFLREGCTNTAFLRDNEINIVYSQLGCENPNLIEVRENIYIIRESTEVSEL